MEGSRLLALGLPSQEHIPHSPTESHWAETDRAGSLTPQDSHRAQLRPGDSKAHSGIQLLSNVRCASSAGHKDTDPCSLRPCHPFLRDPAGHQSLRSIPSKQLLKGKQLRSPPQHLLLCPSPSHLLALLGIKRSFFGGIGCTEAPTALLPASGLRPPFL